MGDWKGGEIRRIRMLQVGSQLPFHNGYDVTAASARKWIQGGNTRGREATELPTIIGSCEPLPDDEWRKLCHGIAISGLMDIVGNPSFPSFHLPTWYFDVETESGRRRLKAYAIDGMTVQTGADWEDDDVWSAGLAASEIRQFERRVPWNEHLEVRSVAPDAALADLLNIGGEWNPASLPPAVEWRLRKRILANEFTLRLRHEGILDDSQYHELVDALSELGETWRRVKELDKELVNYVVTSLGMLAEAEETARSDGKGELAEEIGRRRSNLNNVVAGALG
jgi:hypothetical protein